MKRKLINWLCLLGVLQIVFYFLHDLIGGLNYPGYDFLTEAVSVITAVGSPSKDIAMRYLNVYNVLGILSLSLVSILIANHPNKYLRIGVYLFTIMSYFSIIGFPLFPLSGEVDTLKFQDFVHYGLTIIVVGLSIVSLVFVIISAFKGEEKSKVLGIIAAVCLVLMFAGAVGGGIMVGKPGFGILERFSTYSAVLFGSVLSVYGFQYPNNFKTLETETL